MAEWFVELALSEPDYNLLRPALSPPGPSIIRERKVTLLRSPEIPPALDHLQAHEAATSVIEAINGAAKAYIPTFEGARIVSMHFLDDEGKSTRHMMLTAPYHDYRLHAVNPSDPTIREWITLSGVDPIVARALTLYGSLAHNWKNLYMVLEVIEQDIGGEAALVRKFPEPEYSIKSFKRTANSFAALGREARHAKDFQALLSPMAFRDAQDLTHRLIRSWLNGKRLQPPPA